MNGGEERSRGEMGGVQMDQPHTVKITRMESGQGTGEKLPEGGTPPTLNAEGGKESAGKEETGFQAGFSCPLQIPGWGLKA